VESLIKLMAHAGAVGQVFNLGSQEEVSIEELAKRIIRLTGSLSRIEYVTYETAYEEGYEDMPRRVPDTSKIRSLIGFRPSMNLDQIITSVVESASPARVAAAPASAVAAGKPAAAKAARKRKGARVVA
jgi:UDP-glucose 4-epimerase